MSRWRRWSDQLAQRLLGLIAGAVCMVVVGVAAALLLRSLPLLSTFSPFELWGGQVWQPMRGLFGYAPFVAGSLWVTAVAMAVAVVPAVFSGIYLAEYVSERGRGLLKPLLDLLVGI
ncbi:MAG: phosphate ABC transporter permease subunit PstC, partial [Caldilinea sp.]